MGSPQITVILAAYNSEKTIEESIESILNQTFADFEFLIADDCSTDNTRNIIDGFKDRRIKTFHNTKNMHVVWTWNFLSNKALGKYITFQDADDISLPNRLELLHNAACKNPTAAIIGANHIRYYKTWKMFIKSNFAKNRETFLELLEKSKIVSSCGPRSLFDRNIFMKMNGFREILPKSGWSDFDLIIRIAEQFEIYGIDETVYEYRYSPYSISRLNNSKDTQFYKYIVHDVGIFLYHQRKMSNGLDGLMEGGNIQELNEFIELKREDYLDDTNAVNRKIIRNQCSNKDFKNAIKTYINTVSIKSIKTKDLSILFYIINTYFRTVVKYILIKMTL